jgi:nucleoside-diphosphate-sugar epimerase
LKDILIIGGYGFVGRTLTQQLIVDPSVNVYIVDNFLSSDRDLMEQNNRIKVIEGDAGDPQVLETLPTSIQEIYILNCLHGNQSSLFDPLSDLRNTLMPVIATLEWVRRENPTAKVVYAGAGCAVAEKTWDDAKPVEEVDVISLNHDSPYSISKLTGEMHAIMYAKQFNLNIARARFQNAYGPGEVLGAGKWRGTPASIWRNVTPTFIWKALNNEDLTVTGKQASRDFIYVEDLALGLQKIMLLGESGEAYNLASGRENSIFEWANQIISICESSAKVNVIAARNWDNSGRRFGSTVKSQTRLGFEAEVFPSDGLAKTISWTRSNMDFIESKISKHRNHLEKD